MKDKQNIYLDKVVEFLVRDTKIDFKGNQILLPSSFLPFSPSLFPLYPLPLSHFSKYSKVTYGLTDQEIRYVWNEYKKVITDKINYDERYQKIYLDKVIEFLVRDTKIYYDIDKIKFPFYSLPFSISSYFLPFIYYRFLSPQFTSLFSKYCIDYYGLTDQEIKYVWIEYKTIIKIKIENNE